MHKTAFLIIFSVIFSVKALWQFVCSNENSNFHADVKHKLLNAYIYIPLLIKCITLWNKSV